jgi:hypothetical protein
MAEKTGDSEEKINETGPKEPENSSKPASKPRSEAQKQQLKEAKLKQKEVRQNAAKIMKEAKEEGLRKVQQLKLSRQMEKLKPLFLGLISEYMQTQPLNMIEEKSKGSDPPKAKLEAPVSASAKVSFSHNEEQSNMHKRKAPNPSAFDDDSSEDDEDVYSPTLEPLKKSHGPTKDHGVRAMGSSKPPPVPSAQSRYTFL